MNVKRAYVTKNPCYKEGRKITPKGIVVHSTAVNNPYLKRYVDAPDLVGENSYGNHWNREDMDVCVHAFIGKTDKEEIMTVQILPYNFACWGVGAGEKGSFNYDPTGYIQFEICEDDGENREYLLKVWKEAVEYATYLCEQYQIPPENIVSHKEAHALGYGSNHGDPEHWFMKHDKTMGAFRREVKNGLKSEEIRVYRVQVGVYREKENANAMEEKLKRAGFPAYVFEDILN